MARPVTLSDYHQMQRGELEASGDTVQSAAAAATVDNLTGGVVANDDDDGTERPKAIGAGSLAYDVAPDGTVGDVRPAEMTPDRGDVTAHHAIDDDDRRFSGAGASDDTDAAIRAFNRGDDEIDDDWVDGGPAPSALIPTDQQFSGRLYREAPELANIADQLIGEHGFLEDLVNCDIRWYWKRKTGVSKGRVKIGFMKRASDLLGHFSGADFIGWLSATTARDGKFTDEQVKAAVFHQLLHVGSDDKGNWIFQPHDFEGFAQEVRVFGTWTSDLKLGGTAFVAAHQMGLFDATDEDDDDDQGEGYEITATSGDLEDLARGDVLAKYRPADPDQPYDEDLEDLPTGEEIDAARAKASSDLADLPFG